MCCSVNGLVCCVFVNCLLNQFAICLVVVVILLLKCLVCVDVLCWIDRVWSSTECACDPSVHLSVPSIGFVYVFVCRKLTSHLRVSELAPSIVSLCDFAYYVVG